MLFILIHGGQLYWKLWNPLYFRIYNLKKKGILQYITGLFYVLTYLYIELCLWPTWP